MTGVLTGEGNQDTNMQRDGPVRTQGEDSYLHAKRPQKAPACPRPDLGLAASKERKVNVCCSLWFFSHSVVSDSL